MATPSPDLFPEALRLYQAGDFVSAQDVVRQLLSQDPNHDRGIFLLGLTHHRLGQQDVAAREMERAIELNPHVASYYSNYSAILHAAGRNDRALAAATEALRRQPRYPEALVNLGTALMALGRVDEAIAAYRRVAEISPPPNLPGPHLLARNNLARALHIRGNLDDAIEILQELIRLHPEIPEFHINLANALKDQGRIEEAIVEHRDAVRAAPGNAAIGSALLYALWFTSALSQDQVFAEHLAWACVHANPLRDSRPHSNTRDSDRHLRIGYVSPDFRDHSSGHLIEPVLAHHNHQHFAIFCYSNAAVPDAFTEIIKSHADTWRDTAALSDADLADLIRADEIDILVDLTCHMAHNRALVFARKPAPVQVNYLAYPATSGMSAMDYRITTEDLDPSTASINESALNTERLFRIPDTFWCYGPSPTGPEPNDLPALSSDVFTFGSLNAYGKVNDDVVALWCKVLHAVPHSRLLALIPGGAQGNRSAARRFASHGIDPARIYFVGQLPRDDYLALFHQVDLSLDPFPYNGHTTSLDSLWIGVPFVTLKGKTAISRAGECLLRNLHLNEFVAPTPEAYVEICKNIAADRPRLAKLRRELRNRLKSSPLADARRFTHHLENAYREMWRAWCTSQAG